MIVFINKKNEKNMHKIRLNESQFNRLVGRCVQRIVKNALKESVDDDEEEEYVDAFESGEYDNMKADEKYCYWVDDMGYIPDEIPDDEYEEMLNQRREEIAQFFGWTIPDLVWDEYIDLCHDCGFNKSETPMVVVDNIAVNGDYGDFDDYKKDGESDEDFIDRAEGEALRVFPEERFVIYNI